MKNIFLDLEGTLIATIDNAELASPGPIVKWINSIKPDSVSIFSFAIDNAADRSKFRDSGLQKILEDTFSFKTLDVITVEEVKRAIQLKNHIILDNLTEVKQLWGKTRGFIDFCHFHFSNCECILLDDMVEDMHVHFTVKNLTVRTVSVFDLR